MTVTEETSSTQGQSPKGPSPVATTKLRRISRVRRIRRVVACLLLGTLVLWPAWSLVDFCLFLQRYQPTPAIVNANWADRDQRFAALSNYLEPGAVVAYHTNWPLPPNGSMLHEAQLAGAPVIITDIWYPHTNLVLLDVADDSLLQQAIQEHGYELIKHFGDGLALCRRDNKTPDRQRQNKDAQPAEVTP